MDNNVLGIRFRRTGKMVYMLPCQEDLKVGDKVIAESEKGKEIGRIVKILTKDEVKTEEPLNKIIKKATIEDDEKQKQNVKEAEKVLEFTRKELKNLQLNMKLLFCEYTFDKGKLTIYFTSDERVDFRELVKTLATRYKTRIELRQIGPRDEVKAYSNLGMCGREVCCRTYLQDFKSVTIKDAKEQGLQINMSKLSGGCGRLMCCLKYEEETYRDNSKKLPKVNEIVSVRESGEVGKVIGIDILNLKVKVKLGDTRENESIVNFKLDELIIDN